MIFNYDDYFEEALELYENDKDVSGDKTAVSRFLKHKYNIEKSIEAIRKAMSSRLNKHYADKEIIEQNIKLGKQKQKAQDQNRIANKSFREYARLENAVSEYGKALTEQNKIFGEQLSKININPIMYSSGGIGVMQITDVHGNELIDLPHNKYDFKVLSKRLKNYTNESIRYFKYRGNRKVIYACTGDLLNSDRRLDELLNQSTNRSKASILMIHLLKQSILEVRNAGYEVHVVSVLGNESRVTKEMTFSKEAFSDNYDFTIIAQLKEMFEFANIKGVTFGSHDDLELVLKIEKHNLLLKHNLDKTLDNQKNTQSAIGVQSLKGRNVTFAIGGHIHAFRGSDLGVRASSMSGSNSYNENALGLMGKSSGVCYSFEKDKIFFQYIDLQNSNNEGYEIIEKLEAYNAKSVSKTVQKKTVFEVVI